MVQPDSGGQRPGTPAAFNHMEERKLLGGLDGEGGDGEGEGG